MKLLQTTARYYLLYSIIILLIGFPIYIYYIWKFRLLKYEIQQTEDPNTPYNKSAFQKMYFTSLLVVGLLSGIAITLIVKNNFGENFSLTKIQGNDRIAVLEFTNNTNDEKLNIIGKITANWIIHGIGAMDPLTRALVFTNMLTNGAIFLARKSVTTSR